MEHSVGAENQFPLFNAYAGAKLERLAYLAGVLRDALPILDNFDGPGGTNDKLTEAGRSDLAISEPATMMPISHPLEVHEKCNNFSPNFHLYTGGRETGELDFHDQPKMEPVPATEKEVLALRELPKLNSYDEFVELRDSEKYPALDIHNHTTKPAFIRMLHLFPDFATILVTEMSAPENQYNYAAFEAELFVAYQLMSRLVDKSDQHVLNDAGEVEDWYLCK